MGEAAKPDKSHESTTTEARATPRADTSVCIEVFSDLSSDDDFWTGLTMDLSDGGVFIATSNVVSVGTRVILKMLLPSETEPIVARAEVRWAREISGDGAFPSGVGLQFVEIDADSLARVRGFLSSGEAGSSVD